MKKYEPWGWYPNIQISIETIWVSKLNNKTSGSLRNVQPMPLTSCRRLTQASEPFTALTSSVLLFPYMQKTCDVAEKAILAKNNLWKKCVYCDKMLIATKVRISWKSIKNGENRQKMVKIDKKWCYFHLKWCYLNLRWCYLRRWLGCSIDFAFSA